MKRDMDVIRAIVLASIESDESIQDIPGIDNHVFGFHAELLDEAGLAKCVIHETSDTAIPQVELAIIWRLTWDGFEFAESIKDPDVWEKAKQRVIKPAASWTFGILLEIIKHEAKKKLGLDT